VQHNHKTSDKQDVYQAHTLSPILSKFGMWDVSQRVF